MSARVALLALLLPSLASAQDMVPLPDQPPATTDPGTPPTVTPAPAPTPPAAPLAPTLPPPVVASGHARVAPFLPTLDIATSTDGTTQITAGFDLVVGMTNGWDFAFSPIAKARAGSLADLFTSSTTAAGSNAVNGRSWLFGGSFTFTQLGLSVEPDRPGSGGHLDQVKSAAVQACRADCNRVGATEAERRICTLQPWEIDPGELCPAGREIIRGDLPLHEWSGRFPRLALSLGAMVGTNQFTFLTHPADSDFLAVTTESHLDVAAATSVTFVKENGFTLELPLVYTHRELASSNTVNNCTTVGEQQLPNQMEQPLQSCQTLPYGVPKSEDSVKISLLFGWAQRVSGFFRASIGPTFAYTQLGGTTAVPQQLAELALPVTSFSQTTIGLIAPFYLNFASAPSSYVGDYKGLLRITPSLLYIDGPAGWSPSMFVVIELLGQRTMFGKALDWL